MVRVSAVSDGWDYINLYDDYQGGDAFVFNTIAYSAGSQPLITVTIEKDPAAGSLARPPRRRDQHRHHRLYHHRRLDVLVWRRFRRPAAELRGVRRQRLTGPFCVQHVSALHREGEGQDARSHSPSPATRIVGVRPRLSAVHARRDYRPISKRSAVLWQTPPFSSDRSFSLQRDSFSSA